MVGGWGSSSSAASTSGRQSMHLQIKLSRLDDIANIACKLILHLDSHLIYIRAPSKTRPHCYNPNPVTRPTTQASISKTAMQHKIPFTKHDLFPSAIVMRMWSAISSPVEDDDRYQNVPYCTSAKRR